MLFVLLSSLLSLSLILSSSLFLSAFVFLASVSKLCASQTLHLSLFLSLALLLSSFFLSRFSSLINSLLLSSSFFLSSLCLSFPSYFVSPYFPLIIRYSNHTSHLLCCLFLLNSLPAAFFLYFPFQFSLSLYVSSPIHSFFSSHYFPSFPNGHSLQYCCNGPNI